MSQEGEFLRLRRGDFFFSGEGFCLSCEEDFFFVFREGDLHVFVLSGMSGFFSIRWGYLFVLGGGSLSRGVGSPCVRRGFSVLGSVKFQYL